MVLNAWKGAKKVINNHTPVGVVKSVIGSIKDTSALKKSISTLDDVKAARQRQVIKPKVAQTGLMMKKTTQTIKKPIPKYDDRTGGMTGAPLPKFQTGMPKTKKK